MPKPNAQADALQQLSSGLWQQQIEKEMAGLRGSVAGSSATNPMYVMEVKPVKLDGLGGVGD